MKKSLLILLALSLMALMLTPALAASTFPKALSLDTAAYPDYDYSRANKLPLTGYFEKSFTVGSDTRTAKVYISATAPIRSFFTVIAVPDGVDTTEFMVKSGWKDIADKEEECLLLLEPGKKGWGKGEDEQAYVNAVINFYKGNRFFSIFGMHYFVGYGGGGAALEGWSAANPLFVPSQVFVNSDSLGDAYYAQFASKLFDGKNTGYTPIEIPEAIKIAYNEVPVPTWYINESLKRVEGSMKYWKGANDCVEAGASKADYLLGSQVFAQSAASNAWQTDYSGPISKVAALEKRVDVLDAKLTRTIYNFLTEYVRYDNNTAYGNQLAERKGYGQIHTMMVNGFLREYMIYVPESAAQLYPDGAPVMFVFAGNSQTDQVFWHATLWWKVADKEGVILVIPCEQYSSNSTVVSHKDTDIFYLQLADLMKKYYNVDPTRFYATGQSAGSMAAMGFGMTNPEFFAAIASTSGLRPPTDAATYAMMPVYAICGEGDITDMTGSLWDATDNNLDKWAAYYLKANGIAALGDQSKGVKNGRYTTWTWANKQGFPLVKFTQTSYRAHNNIMAEMPMLWDWVKHWSFKDGVRYYDGVKVDEGIVPKSLDDAVFPDYNYTRANKLPLTGFFEKSFDVNGTKRTAKFYVSPNAPIRAFFTIVAVPDGVNTNDFIVKSGWKGLADANEEGLFILEPAASGWGKPEDELAYINAANDFYKSNKYFSIFGENYLIGYGKGGTALEAWAAANPLFVTSQAYVNSESLSDAYYAQFAGKFFTESNTIKEIPKDVQIAVNEVPVPTWYVNSSLAKVEGALKYWKAANDCAPFSTVTSNYLYGSQVFKQAEGSDAWQTDYNGPISKVAAVEKAVNIWSPDFTKVVFNFLTEYVRYDNTSAYGNQLAPRKPYGDIRTMMVNGFLREYMVYVPESAEKLWPDGAPVLFVWAGNSQTDKVFWYATEWWKVADEEGVILVFPCEQYSSNSTVVSHKDSVMFHEQLALLMKGYYNVDPTRFYATGQSAGGGESTNFAMNYPEFYAAVAVTSGLRAPAETATNRAVPYYAISGEGDNASYTGNLWDATDNNLDKCIAYFLKAHGLALGDQAAGVKEGRFTTYTWENEQGFPVVQWTQTAYRAHNNLMAEMPMLWDWLEHWSLEDGIRYYDVNTPVPVK